MNCQSCNAEFKTAAALRDVNGKTICLDCWRKQGMPLYSENLIDTGTRRFQKVVDPETGEQADAAFIGKHSE